MRLDQLLKHFLYESVQGSHDLIITDICYHSGKVKRGSLFVCIKGQYTDGHDYIMDAVKAGAFAVVVDESCMVNVRWECFIYTEHGKVRVHELVRNYGMAVIGVKDTRPVSYTHLDVYKRQGYYCELMKDGESCKITETMIGALKKEMYRLVMADLPIEKYSFPRLSSVHSNIPDRWHI